MLAIEIINFKITKGMTISYFNTSFFVGMCVLLVTFLGFFLLFVIKVPHSLGWGIRGGASCLKKYQQLDASATRHIHPRKKN